MLCLCNAICTAQYLLGVEFAKLNIWGWGKNLQIFVIYTNNICICLRVCRCSNIEAGLKNMLGANFMEVPI